MSKNKIFSYDVIIIGAGIAGITAAKLFDENNVSNILIEADNRIGGRAKCAEASFGSWFDLGCSYLHEGDINPFTKIAKNFNIPISHKKGDFFSIEKTNYFFNKKIFSKHKINLLKNSINDLKRNICRYVEINEDISLSKCLNKDDPNNILITNYLTGLNAIEPNFLSTIDFASVNEGKDLIIETGLAKMIKSWACGVNAEINNPVNKIKWGKDLIEVHTKSKKYISKTVLITVSTGILKNQDITFIPNLPKYKIQAINNLPMGILNKIGVLFKEGTFSDKDIGWYVACEGKDDENVSNIFNCYRKSF